MSSTQGTARVKVLAEGEYDVAVSQQNPVTLSQLLDGLGIRNRDGQLYMNGAPVQGDPVVEPGSETVVMPLIRGG
jgi:hypothetical protein